MKALQYLRWQWRDRLRPMLRGPDPQYVQQRNIWHLYQDLVWLGFATAVNTYINVYALRLGASPRLLGWRTSIPSLLVVLLRVPAAQIIERASDRKRLIVRSLFFSRMFYFLIFLLPWLGMLPVIRQIPQAQLFVWAVVLMGVPSILSAAGWDSFFADIVPAERRARVVSMRSTMTHLMMLSVVPLMGSYLDWATFPFNYQSIFLLAFIGAMMSIWHVAQIKMPATASPPRRKAKALNLKEARRIFRDTPEFATLAVATLVYQSAISIASPLFIVYFVDHLGASDSWIGFRMTLASFMSIVAFRVWPGLLERYGERKIITLATPVMALFPLLTGLTRTLSPHMFIVLLPRFFGAAVMLSRYNMLLRVCPADRRPTYIAIYAILNNVAAFITPLIGVELAGWIGIHNVFFVSAGLRIVAALLYQRLPLPMVMDD